MYIFSKPVFQSGGGTSDGTLMQPSEGNGHKHELKICQYFERHGREDVEFSSPAAFCDYLAKYYFKDGRSVFFKEDVNSHNLTVYSTSPYTGHEREIFVVGEFIKQ